MISIRSFVALTLGTALTAPLAMAQTPSALAQRHVLLISVDGMHGLDFRNCAYGNICPNMAALASGGVHYIRTSTAKPSDSFPGLMAIVTGGTPKLVGAYYDVAYDRVLAPPASDTGNGVLHGSCTAGQPNGTRTEYEEGIDIDQTLVNGGGPYGATDGGIASMDPKKMPRDPFNNCAPVYPWNFIRANTIYGVIHEAGGYTAWSDKHPAYAAVSGPSGTAKASNLDDFYAPEINSNAVGLPGVKTATGLDCTKLPVSNGGDWTTDFDNIKCYDQLKVNAVLNWIQGKTHMGAAGGKVPAIFGMNFQAVSVGQKLIEGSVKGGYTNSAGAMTYTLENEFKFVDAAIGQFVTELKRQHLFDSTTIIITAKHGQGPIDPSRFVPIPGHSGANGTAPSDLLGSAYLPDSEINQIGATQDDISLLWLKPNVSSQAAVNLLETNGKTAGIGQILWGASLEELYNRPGLPAQGDDPRTPDIIVVPNTGVIYTGSLKKQSEHGGFSPDDTNVVLIVSNPSLTPRTITSFVETTQVAPTILEILGLDPNRLDAVQREGTPALPGLHFRN